ncbi:MAG: outer membrane beta-barrel family protein [Cyclobacteriaceae bacterium]
MRKILLTLLIINASIATAQKFSVTGELADSLGNSLPGATVLLLSPRDSSLVNFSVADNHGRFVLKNIGDGQYLLKVTFLGYRPFAKLIAPAENSPVVDLGKIQLEPVSNDLEAIEIAAERPPVTVKKDTIEFNARSFKTKENAMVEDLLKKLPGLEVDNDGNVTAQGEQVKNVTVDGKKFFGNDPTLATRNLPAEAVDKVQVFDKQSDQATFTGIDDGEREKTINLELKAEKRNAIFGNMMAGAGPDDRLQARFSLNKFTRGRQLSLLGMGNNVNQSGFGMAEYMNFTGGAAKQMMSGGARIQINSDNANGVPLNFGNRANGMMTTYAGGINLNQELSKRTEVNGSYFYNYLNHDRDQTTLRENFLESGNFTFNQNSIENNSNSNHRANVTLDHKIDSANTLRVTSNFSLNETDSEQHSTSENKRPDGSFASENERGYSSGEINTTLNSNLLYRHRFGKKGRSFSTNIQLRFNRNETRGILEAINTFYGENPMEQVLKQNNKQSTDYLSYGATVSYTEPLGKGKYLEANYNFRQNTNEVIRDVFNINNGEGIFDPVLSNRYNSDYQYHRGGINLRISKGDYNLVAGTSLQKTYLAGELELSGSATNRSFTNLLPSARFNYNFSNSRHLRFDYETSVREPDIRELQPVVDNSDPLNIYTGNPNLRPSYSQSWRLNFTSFNPVTFISFFAFSDVDYTSNAIVNAQSVDGRFVRTITPINISNSLSFNNNVNVGVPIRKIGSRLHLGGNFRKVNSIAVLNGEENDINQQTLGGNFQYNYEYKEIFDLTLSTRVDHRQTSYEFDQPDQKFFNQTYGLESNVGFLKKYSLNVNFDYLIYVSRSMDFDQRIPLLNLSVSRFLLKNRSGELKLGVINLLDKALNVEQTANINYLELVTTDSLGRYFMLSFTYALNKQLNPMAMRRGGPMMKIIK